VLQYGTSVIISPYLVKGTGEGFGVGVAVGCGVAVGDGWFNEQAERGYASASVSRTIPLFTFKTFRINLLLTDRVFQRA
jgi:hypothetical protein